MFMFYIIGPDHSTIREFRNGGAITNDQNWIGVPLTNPSECQMMIPGTLKEEDM